MFTTESSPLVANASFFANTASYYKLSRNIALSACFVVSAINAVLLGTDTANYSDPARSKIIGVVNGLWVIAGTALLIGIIFQAKKNAEEAALDKLEKINIQNHAYQV